MATVRLSFSPAPVHVRTARLVGVAVARRAGVAEELLDEVRLAIGEACTRAVALHNQYGLPDLVTVEMSDSDSYAVRVIDHAPIEASVGLAKLPPDELADESLTDEALTTGVGFALLAGFVDDLQVRPVEDGPGTEVRMVWPVQRARDAAKIKKSLPLWRRANTAANITTTRPEPGVTTTTTGRYSTRVISYCSWSRVRGTQLSSPR